MSSAVATQNNGESISSDGNYYPVQHPHHLDGDDYSYAVHYNPSLSGSVGGYVMPPQQQYSSAPPTPDYPHPQLVSPFYAPHPDAASSYSTDPPPPHFGPPHPHQQQHAHHEHHHHHHAAAALPPQLPQFQHPSQQMYYGPAPWPVVPSLHSALLGYQQQQQVAAAAGHYNHPPYPRSVSLTVPTSSSMTADLPRRGSNGGGRRSSMKANNHKDPLHPSYGSLELNVFDVENYDQLVSALNLVKRNSKATLFDIDGMCHDDD
jgi:hypothetical protein